MKRVISLTICVIILAFTMCSCGSQLPFTGDSSTKELKFEDKHFEKYMNVMFGKLDGGVTQEDMDSIKQIQLMGNDYYKNFIEYMYDDYEYNSEYMDNYGYKYTLETGGKLGKVPTVPQIKYSDDYEYATSSENDFEPMTYNDVAKFRNLQVLTKDGEYTRAAAMLFGNPEDVIFGAYIRIGFFEGGRLKYQDEIHGPLISQAHRATEMIFHKYLKALVDIKGLQRTETYMTTEEILREVILNAVAHKYYPSNVAIQIKVFDDHITVMNEGFWPFDNLAVEDVYGEHSSYPANPTIDNGLFFAGAMDTWGQGFLLIMDECGKIDAPLPAIKATDKYVTVTIHGCSKYMELLQGGTETYNDSAVEYESILSEEEIGALLIFCREPKSRREMQEFMPKWSRTAFGDNVLKPLLASGRLLMTKPDSPKAPNQKYYANTEKLTT